MDNAGITPNIITYTTLFSKNMETVDIKSEIAWFYARKYHPSQAFEPLIRNLHKINRMEDAYSLIFSYPHLGSSRKIIKVDVDTAIKWFKSFSDKESYDKNIDYALGIAYYEGKDYKMAENHLTIALTLCENIKRKANIKITLKECRKYTQ